MDATQMINDSILESDDEENEQENGNKRRQPLAKLCILKNEHIPERELPLFVGDNVLGRDPNTCILPFPAPSISKQHATIYISVYRRRGSPSEVDIEALVWDLGSMNGTRKGRIKLTPNVRYALSDGDSLVVADIPCRYVSCAVNTVSSQEDMRTRVSRNLGLGVKARLPDALGEKRDDTSIVSKKCVNRSSTARMSLTQTPVKTNCLSFEETPTQPQGTLVPESDSSSDDERRGGEARGCKALASDFDSYKSSPACSTFLSPTNKIVPESEDESPITPSSSTKNRPYRDVSLNKETDVNVGRQQLTTVVDDREEEQRKEEESVILGGTESDKNGQHAAAKQERNVSLIGDELPVPTPEVSTHAIPVFNMESDTDAEGEEEGMTFASRVSLNQVSQPPNTDEFHMGSDTDIDEDEDALDRALKTLPCSVDSTKAPHFLVIQPDSDTDVDDDTAVSDADTKAKPVSFQSAHIADAAPSTQPKNFYLDSGTDVDEEKKAVECGKSKPSSKIDACHSRLDEKSIGPKSTPAAPHRLHLDSDTDDEAVPTSSLSKPQMVYAATESSITVDARAELNIPTDSDTDVEDDSPLVIPVDITELSVSPATVSDAPQSDSDADTDVDEYSMPPARDVDDPADRRVDSCTDVENNEADILEPGEDQIPDLCIDKTPGLLLPPLRNCSTPVHLSGVALSSCSDSQEDEDFVVAETQSFILQTRGYQGNPPDDHIMDPIQAFHFEHSDDEKDEPSSHGASFQLGISDSSHLQDHAQALAMESTQAFLPVDRNVKDTQAYAAISTADRTSAENTPNMDDTQTFGEGEERARCSVMPEREGQVDLALEATQAYISELYSDSEDKTDEDDTKNKSAETIEYPTSSTLAMAETQPVSAFEEEEIRATDKSDSYIQPVESKTQNETDEREEYGAVLQTHQRPFSEVLPLAETQPIHTVEDGESDDESVDKDSFPGPRRRKAKPLHLEEEQTQPLTNSETQPMCTSVAEAQTMATSRNEEGDVDITVPGLQNKEDKTAVEAQPMDTVEDEESDQDSIPGFRKRRVKPMQLEEETQLLGSSEVSAVETQPIGACEDEKSSDEDSISGPDKKKSKPLQLEEQTQSVICSEVSPVETQPIVMGEDKESSDEDLIPVPRKKKAEAQQLEEEDVKLLTNSDVSTVEIQALETKNDGQPEKVIGRQSEAGTSGVTYRNKRGTLEKLKEEQQAKCSDVPKIQTRGKNKALPTNRGKRGKSRPHGEEEVEQPRPREKKNMRQQKNDKEEEEQFESERPSENNSLIKEKPEGRIGEKKNVANLRQEEREKMENGNGEDEEREREQGEMERQQRADQQEKIEREGKEKREDGLKAENAESIRLEQERAEKETKEQEEKERYDWVHREKEEQFERERKQNKEISEHEKAEREENEKLNSWEKEKIEMERKEQEENERLDVEKRELEQRFEREKNEQEHLERVEREERERLEKEKKAKEKQRQEQQENMEEKNKPKVPIRGRRAARRTITTQPEQDAALSTNDVPARRTRSRSNSSNSVSSEKSASSINTQESRGRGRGRGVKRASEPPQAAITRSSNRRTVATESSQQDSSPLVLRSRSNSSNSLNSGVSSCGVGFQVRGRRRKTEPESIPPVISQINQNSTPKPAARGRKSKKAEGSSDDVFQEEDKEKADSQLATATRRRQQTSENASEPAAADDKDQLNQEACHASEDSLRSKRNFRVRGQTAVKSTTVATPGPPVVGDGGQTKDKRLGRKRGLVENAEDDSSSSSKISKGKEKVQTTETREEKGKDETKGENPVQVKRRGRPSTAQGKKNPREFPPKVEVQEEKEKIEVETVKKREKGRSSAVQNKKKEMQEDSSGTSVSSMSQDAKVATSQQPQTPTSSVSRKRQTPVDSSSMAKTPRSSSASPAATGRLRATSQSYKVLFTGVVDEAGEKVLARLGGSMAKGVADMNCLVTDKVRRTVKFLCAVAKGIPIVTTHWLEKSGKAGSFLPPNAFVVKDPEQEKKFSFSLQESLRTASSQPLLQGYEIHVTKSVKPEPVQMKDIISCSGATFLPKMPSSYKPQTVVISCEEDWLLCDPAVSASLPVFTAEFILTGILQQKLDFQTHTLSAPTAKLQPAGGRGRSRKKT